MVVEHNVVFLPIRAVQAGVWNIGVLNFNKTPGASWLALIPIVCGALAIATDVSTEWTATELNSPCLGAYPSRAMTILTDESQVRSVKQHLDLYDRPEGGLIMWLQTGPCLGYPKSVSGGFFWMSGVGIRLAITPQRYVWLQTGVVRHGTTGGAEFVDSDAVRVGMAFYANVRSVSALHKAVQQNPNAQAARSVNGFLKPNKTCGKKQSGSKPRVDRKTSEYNKSGVDDNCASTNVHQTRSRTTTLL